METRFRVACQMNDHIVVPISVDVEEESIAKLVWKIPKRSIAVSLPFWLCMVSNKTSSTITPRALDVVKFAGQYFDSLGCFNSISGS